MVEWHHACTGGSDAHNHRTLHRTIIYDLATGAISGMSTGVFIPNERVLCYHGPLMYEAKVLKMEHWDESNTKTGAVGPHYFVHYKGWKQTYVPPIAS